MSSAVTGRRRDTFRPQYTHSLSSVSLFSNLSLSLAYCFAKWILAYRKFDPGDLAAYLLSMVAFIDSV
jgi:hypothetical protein